MISGRQLKRYSRQFFHNVFDRKTVHFLIFFITSRCNCRCGTCFYWKELNKDTDLSIGEIRRFSEKLGRLNTLLLSGGEPFLREDIPEICGIFIKQNNLSTLAIPTNGTLPGRVIEVSEKLLKGYPLITLSIAVSLDGLKETHDSIRGIEGVFDKAVETLNRLAELRKHHGNLDVVVNTVVTAKNLAQIPDLMDFVYDKLKVDHHEFELLRGDYKDKELGPVQFPDLNKIHDLILKNTERYLKRDKSPLLERIAVLGYMSFVQKIKERSLDGKKAPFECSAGRNICVIDANGDVRLCELLKPVGNLKSADYDLYGILRSPAASGLKKNITDSGCSCTHVCFIKLSSARYLRSLFHVVYSYLSY